MLYENLPPENFDVYIPIHTLPTSPATAEDVLAPDVAMYLHGCVL